MGAAVPLVFVALGVVLVVVGLLVWWFYLRPKEGEEEGEDVSYASVDNFNVSTVTQDDVNDELRMFQVINAAPPLTENDDSSDPLLSIIKDPETWRGLAIGGSPEMLRHAIETYIDYKNSIRGFPPETATGRLLRAIRNSSVSLTGRLGAIGDSKAVKKAAVASGINIAEEAGERAAVKAGTRTVMATPLKFLFAAYEAVDFIGLVLDQFLGAYSDQTLDENYITQMRDYSIELLRRDMEEDKGLKWPQIVGPLDKLSADVRAAKYTEIFDKLYKNDQTFFNLFMNGFNLAVVNGNTTEERNNLFKDHEKRVLRPLIYQEWAQEVGGKVVIDPDGEIDMSFATKEQCDSSYDWPLKPNQVFAMWSNDNGGYSYIGPGRILMEMCGSWGEIGKDVTINKETYTCCVSSTVCRENATEPAGGCFCKIEESQKVLEMLFGKTIVRGLKQIFDPKMYEDCPEGSTDTGLTCLSSDFKAYARPAKPPRCDRAEDGWFASVPGVGNIPDSMCAKCPSRFPYHKAATCYKNKSDADSANLGAIRAPAPSCPPDGYPDYTKRTSGVDPLCYHKDVDINLLIKVPSYGCQDGYSECKPLKGFCYPDADRCCVRTGPHQRCHPKAKLPKPKCPSGYYYTAGMCYADSHNAKKECPDGYELDMLGGSCVKSIPIPTGDGYSRSMLAMGAETCPEGFPRKVDLLCYADCRSGYEPDPAVPSMCRSKKSFGVMWKKRKVPFAKPDIKKSPFGQMMRDIEDCDNDACRAKVGVFMGLSVLPMMYNTGMIDILNITYDVQAAYTQRDE